MAHGPPQRSGMPPSLTFVLCAVHRGMQIIGHEEARHRLECLSPVTLIDGPEGVGKRLLAREAAQRQASGVHLIEVGQSVCTQMIGESGPHTHGATCEVTTARVAEYLSSRCRLRSPGRAIVFDAGKATTDAANALLKLLEEPPPNTWFLMYASSWVLPTIASRAEHVSVVPLLDEDVVAILRESGVPSERAEIAASMAGGRPGRAFLLEQVLLQRSSVIQLLKAAAEGDRALLSNALNSLMPHSDTEWVEFRREGDTKRGTQIVDLLRVALTESRTNHHLAFQPAELYGIDRLGAAVVDRAIFLCGRRARSALVVRVVVEFLMQAVEERRRKTGGM